MRRRRRPELPRIGWREWVGLPGLNVPTIKVKVDTGARSSALHAFALSTFKRKGDYWARFEVHPRQRHGDGEILCEAPVIDFRAVRSSGGHRQVRPVIETLVRIGDTEWPIEVTLTNRDVMGFRMLLGRQAIRNRFVVDAGRSFLESAALQKELRR